MKYKDGSEMKPLTESPGLRIIDPSKAGDGYWNCEKMLRQTEDLIHALDTLDPNTQKVFHYDHSSGHKCGLKDGLILSHLNMTFGGTGNKAMRDSKITAGCVGDRPAMMYEKRRNGERSVWSLTMPKHNEGEEVVEHDCRVRPGDFQKMSFDEATKNPPPPFYNLDAPYEDTKVREKDGSLSKTKGGKERKQNGYAGKGKGVKQMLWERGLRENGLKWHLPLHHPDYPDKCVKTVLGNCEDFREELTAIEKLITSYGHICLTNPKGHPEIAECGLEFDWGVSKKVFRDITNHKARDHEVTVRKSLTEITLDIAKNTARKARSYMLAYADDSGDSYALIEKFVKIHKCHRNILDQEQAYLEELLLKIERETQEYLKEETFVKAEKSGTHCTLEI